MPEPLTKPLLTFAIAAYNQERFIREAAEAAFAQKYSPLEIVLSDDCSQDNTFGIMQKMAAEYRGPHRIILNRNPVRRSIGGHVNRVVEISRGELIVGAAGDDVSLPERTQAAYEVWEESGRKATSIYSGLIQIDEDGQVIEDVFRNRVEAGQQIQRQQVDALEYVRTLEPIVFGCAHTYSRKLFQVFGALPDEVIHEDNALAFRSILAGELFHIDRPLVKYRVHGGNTYIRTLKVRLAAREQMLRQEERLRRDLRNREIMYSGFLRDLACAESRALVSRPQAEALAREVTRMRSRYEQMGRYLEGNLVQKLRILSSLRRDGMSRYESGVLYKRLIPGSLLLLLRQIRSRAVPGAGRV